MKLTNEQQAAINEAARQLYLIKQAGKVKTEEIAKIVSVVDRNEAAFIDGVPFEFEIEASDGRKRASGKFRLKNSRSWEYADLQFEKVV